MEALISIRKNIVEIFSEYKICHFFVYVIDLPFLFPFFISTLTFFHVIGTVVSAIDVFTHK